MKRKFPNTAGLTDTALVASGKTDITKTSDLVQILHTKFHWLTVSNRQCEEGVLLVYDSLPGSLPIGLK